MWIAHSFAKINLGLHVLERLPSGFHRIETGFCFLEWSDRFEVIPARDYRLELPESAIPTDDQNLITKAYRLFESEAGLKNHYRFTVYKKIPAGGGLGGGSSNAALTLRMLNKLEERGISEGELEEMASYIGSDVPFFIRGITGIGSGRGEQIEPAEIQPSRWIVTVWPGFESSTAVAYERCEPNPDPEFSLREILLHEEPEQWRIFLENDLEGPVVTQYEMIGNMKDQLYDFGALYAAMSGSGSTVFGIFDQDFVAINAYESFHKLGYAVNLTRPDFKPDYGIYFKDN